MDSELQGLVEALAARLHRAVELDDARLRLLAYANLETEVDPVRLASILQRTGPPAAAAWARAQGIEAATGPVRLAANPELGMQARVCVPARIGGELLGFLWVLDPEEDLDQAEVALAEESAGAVAAVLHREDLLRRVARSREGELLRDLLHDDPAVRATAAGELVEEAAFVAATPVAAVVARPAPARDALADDERAELAAALAVARRALPAGHALELVRPDHGVVVVVAAAAPRLADALHARLEPCAPDVVVGVGSVRPDGLRDVATSYAQALTAARVAPVVGAFGPVVAWDDLGVYRLLASLPPAELGEAALHPGLRRLLAAPGGTALVEALEVWLDEAGDARRAAERLHLHRASLYHRLHRVEEVAAVDLHRGDDRLALHLSLKLARLAGLHPARRA